MFNIQRKTLLILVFAILALLLSGLLLRRMILSDFQHLLEGLPPEKGSLFINRIGMYILAWSFFAAALSVLPVVLISRKPVEPGRRIDPMLLRDSNAAPPAAVSIAAEAGTTASQAGIEMNIAVSAPEEEPDAAGDGYAGVDDLNGQTAAGDPDRLKKIIHGLDELAKAQALGRSLQRQQLELALHLNDVVEKTRASVSNKEVLFNLECERGLTVAADPDCLAGIMSNLLDNAAKAVKHGGTVAVSATADNGHIVFAVRDTGHGIRRRDLPHIFERFYRASGSGIGLGLSIVRELVDACGGRIEVETTRGKGSLVTVRIPHS